jgi:hypothetical protein
MSRCDHRGGLTASRHAKKENCVENHNTQKHQSTHRILPIACGTVLAVALTVAPARADHADRVTPPRVPANLQAPARNKVFLEGHASGTQDYVCLPSGTSFLWTFFGPQATLFDDHHKQIITHFLSPNPFEGGTPRATWQHSRDTSAVWGSAIQTSTDANFVRPGAIPWLLLQVVGNLDGPRHGDTLTTATFIQRVNTSGGIAPATGCAGAADVGKKVLVPYKADYFFYKYREHDWDDD